MKYYYYISGNKGMTSSGSFTSDRNRWITFNESEIKTIGTNKPYSATRTGLFILTSKYI
jgi:hypothetical protein